MFNFIPLQEHFQILQHRGVCAAVTYDTCICAAPLYGLRIRCIFVFAAWCSFIHVGKSETKVLKYTISPGSTVNIFNSEVFYTHPDVAIQQNSLFCTYNHMRQRYYSTYCETRYALRRIQNFPLFSFSIVPPFLFHSSNLQFISDAWCRAAAVEVLIKYVCRMPRGQKKYPIKEEITN